MILYHPIAYSISQRNDTNQIQKKHFFTGDFRGINSLARTGVLLITGVLVFSRFAF